MRKSRLKHSRSSPVVSLERFENNPIISPRRNNRWDCGGSFNPGAVRINGKTYIVYRGISRNNVSVLCLATTRDGFNIDERLDEPIFLPREDFEVHPSLRDGVLSTEKRIERNRVNWRLISGGSYCGCEDPRLTRIGNKIYMTYVAFNGIEVPRVALTSIKVKDFVNGNWEWEKSKLITHPNIADKCCVLFPEKIKGKYLFFHRIFPNIWSSYVDSLDFKNGNFIFGKPSISIRPDKWDSRKIGAGSPPIKTEFGWILAYHGVSGWDPYFSMMGLNPSMFKVNDSYRYKIGIMVLDKKNPEKVIFRPDEPSLTPGTWYEGAFAYPSGAVIDKGKLFVYYGAGDYHVALATVDLKEIKNAVKSGEFRDVRKTK